MNKLKLAKAFKLRLLFLIPAVLMFAGVFAQTDSSKETEDDTFTVVEQLPEFPGGTNALLAFVSENVVYPRQAISKNIQGKVYVRFVVEKDGRIERVSIARSVHPLLDNESLRVVRLLPKWKPGQQNGENVAVWYMIPINYTLVDNGDIIPTGTIEIKNIFLAEIFNVYPNPSNGIFNYTIKNNNKPSIITVFDINGKLVKTVQTTGNSGSVNLSNYKRGLYFISVNKQPQTTIKVVKK